MNRIIHLILWVSLISWLIAWNAWMFFGEEWFEVGQAFAIVGLAIGLAYCYIKYFVVQAILIIAINQCVDEFVNPYEITWNEYLTIGALIFICLLELLKSKYRNKQKK